MKVLILTCNTGEGHNSSAAALHEELARRGIACDSVDALGLVSEKVSSFIRKFHISMYRHTPAVFRTGYSFSERHESVFSKRTLVYRGLAGGVGKLRKIILAGQYDCVVSVHVFSALMLTELQRRYAMDIRTSMVATDYTCSPSAASSDLDCYFIPHADLIAEFSGKGLNPSKLIPAGIPIRGAFFEKIPKRKALETLGAAPGEKRILLMSGSMGCGPVEELAERLSEEMPQGAKLTVVCGNNGKLYRALNKTRRDNVQVLGFTKQLPLLMSAADLFISKPGGISITEAAAKHLPMLLLDVVGGCETRNLAFFKSHGWAEAGKSVKDMAVRCAELLNAPELLSEKARRLADEFTRPTAGLVCDYLSGNVGQDGAEPAAACEKTREEQ